MKHLICCPISDFCGEREGGISNWQFGVEKVIVFALMAQLIYGKIDIIMHLEVDSHSLSSLVELIGGWTSLSFLSGCLSAT